MDYNSERLMAENICMCHAQTIVDNAGGITLGGVALAERYAAMWHNMNTYSCEVALRHWVESAGYDKEGKFKYIISNHIINC